MFLPTNSLISRSKKRRNLDFTWAGEPYDRIRYAKEAKSGLFGQSLTDVGCAVGSGGMKLGLPHCHICRLDFFDDERTIKSFSSNLSGGNGNCKLRPLATLGPAAPIGRAWVAKT